MDTSTEQDQDDSLKVIRKLRKKLRQIERLEKNQRELTDEEKVKLSRKHDTRSKLQLLLSTINEANISLDSKKSDDDDHDEDGDQVDEKDDDEQEHDFVEITKTTNDKRDEGMPPDEKSIGDSETSAVAQTVTSSDMKVDERPVLVSKKEKAKKVQNTRSTLRRFWRNSTFQVQELEGHNEAINCIDTTEFWIISGSRDTTLKLWDVVTGKELKSMGGHTGQVTTVKILTKAASDFLRNNIDRSTIEIFTDIEERDGNDERIAISGSTDCSIKLWLLPKGLFIKSIYNYNPISSMAYHNDSNFIIVGSSSGNLTVYNLCSNSQVYSSTIHSSAITEIQTSDSQMITSSVNGSLKVWEILRNTDGQTRRKKQKLDKLEFNVASDDFDISIQHSFEDHEQYLPERHIHCVCTYKGNIIFGDDGTNIKNWNLVTGELTKMRNHKQNVPGITDGVRILNQLLVTSSYDMDHGVGSINVRSLHPDCHGAYIASFSDAKIPRISKFSMQFEQEQKFLVTSGDRLLLWRFAEPGKPRSERGSITLRGQNIAEISNPPADSDVPSDEESSADDDESRWFWQRSKPKPPDVQEEKGSTDDDDSDHDAEDSPKNDSIMNKSGFSICDWCNII